MSRFSIDLTNRSVIITDAGEIGTAIVRAFSASGARLAIADLNPDRAYQAAQEVIAAGGEAMDWQADVSNRFQVAAMIEAARDRFGKVDILVNAAGIFKRGPLLKLDEWDWRRVLDVNLTGTFFCSQLMGRVMADEGGGVIVNIASTAGHPNPLSEGISVTATQSGIIGITRQCARELGPFGVRVNAVCAGNIARDGDVENTPSNALNRSGTVEDIAHAVLFLCSDAARFITGQAINVDGGESMV